jgi:cell wall-associated NlpC family hydrolase
MVGPYRAALASEPVLEKVQTRRLRSCPVVRNPTGFRWSPRSPTPTSSQTLRRAVAAVAVVLPMFTLASPAAADPVANKQAQANRIVQQLAGLSLQVSRLSERYDQARLTVEQLNAKMTAAKSGMGITDARLSGARNRVRDLAVTSYMRGGSAAQLQLLVPKSTADMVVSDAYVRTVASGSSDAVDALRQAHAQLGDQEAQLAADQVAANKALAAAEAARRAAAAADSAERATLAKVQGDLAALVTAAQVRREQTLAGRVRTAVAVRERRQAAQSRRLTGLPIGVQGSVALPPPPPGAGGAIAEAQRELGQPYEYGGSGPASFDCSGLTAWAWGHAGHPLPHSAAAQYDATTHIPISALQPGDLVFFGSPPHHVGLYVGGGQMINALHSGTNVEYDSIYVDGDLIGGGRVN